MHSVLIRFMFLSDERHLKNISLTLDLEFCILTVHYLLFLERGGKQGSVVFVFGFVQDFGRSNQGPVVQKAISLIQD